MKITDGRKEEWTNIEDLNDGDVFEGVDGFFYIALEDGSVADLETGKIEHLDWDLGNDFAKVEEDSDGNIMLFVKKVNAELVIK